MRIDPSNKFFAIAGTNNSILVYDTDKYNLVNTFLGHTGYIYDMAFNPDAGKFSLYSASEDNTVKVWDIILNKCLVSLEAHSAAVKHLTLTNDGKILISISTDNNIILWKLSTNTVMKIIKFHLPIESVIYFTRAKHEKELTPTLLLGCEDGSLIEINLKKDETEYKTVCYIQQPLMQINYISEMNKLYCLTTDQTIVMVDTDLIHEDIEKSSLIRLYPGYCQELLDIKIIKSDNKQMNFLFSSNDNCLKYYDFGMNQIKVYEGHTDFIMNIDVKNNFISTAGKDGSIRIWQFEIVGGEFHCSCIAVLKGHSETVNSTCLMVKKGNQLVSVSKDLTVKVWDFSSALEKDEGDTQEVVIKESKYSQLAHDDEINVIKVSPNEKMIASGSYDKTIKVYIIFNISSGIENYNSYLLLLDIKELLQIFVFQNTQRYSHLLQQIKQLKYGI